jgi:hypothetical protein
VRPRKRLKIAVGSVFSLQPFSPGIAWDKLHWALGLQALGHDVYFLEEVEPDWCRDRSGKRCDYQRSVNRLDFVTGMQRFGLLPRACQLFNGGEATAGLDRESLRAALDGADLLINISGHVKSDAVLGAVKRRVYVDQDPVFTQLWLAEYGVDLRKLSLHPDDVAVTVGLNIGTAHSPIPDGGPEWQHCLPPVVLDHWPCEIDRRSRHFTTIASFGSYSELQFRGSWYRSKRDEFKRLSELPATTDQEVEVALKAAADDPDVALLRDRGWRLVDATRLSSLVSYQAYIRDSRAELGIAKHAYVESNSGWFSDRSAHYLASGKPVLAQSTGFERCLPTGEGLLTFRSLEEAAAGVEAINADYSRHCRAARGFAEEFLDYRKVLPPIIEQAMR